MFAGPHPNCHRDSDSTFGATFRLSELVGNEFREYLFQLLCGHAQVLCGCAAGMGGQTVIEEILLYGGTSTGCGRNLS